MHGFLNIDKPVGPTSHDVVARIRRLTQQQRVGHAGALDPAATGVLVVAIGVATRLIEYVQDETSKRYRAIVRLGAATTTDDAAGEIIATAPVPLLDERAIEQALTPFRGAIMQTPPMYAAIHHEGRRLYELARAGVMVDRPARPVTVERLELIAWSPPDLTLDVLCGKGTYIRALARDLGAALGCGGHLHALRRTAVGSFTIDDAAPLDGLTSVSLMLLPPERAVLDWPAVVLDAEQTRLVRNGQTLLLTGFPGERARAHDPEGRLLALLARADDRWRPTKVFTYT